MTTGQNVNGELGNGTTTHQLNFAPLYKDADPNQPFINPISWDFNWPNGAVVDSKGKLWLSGANSNGQLGNGSTSDTYQMKFKMIESIGGDSNYQATEVLVGERFTIIQIDNFLYGSGIGLRFGMTEDCYTFTKIELPEDEKIIKIDVGAYHLGVLMESGNFFLNGENRFGQLGNGGNPGSWTTPVLPGVKDFSTGTSNLIVLMNDGTLMSSGRNTEGQLGLGTLGQENGVDVDQAFFQTVPNTPTNIISVQAGYYSSVFLTENGNLYFTGNDSFGEFGDGEAVSSARNTFEITHNNVKSFSMGYYHSMIVTNDNKILMFGYNGSGQLGNGTITNIHDANSPEADYTYFFSNNPQISNPPATQIFLLIYFSM